MDSPPRLVTGDPGVMLKTRKKMEIEKSQVVFRKANRKDLDIITKFNIFGTEETTERSPPIKEIERGVSFVLRGHHDFYLMAEYNGDYLGQCKVHYHWYDWYDALFWWVEHLYIAKQHRRKGIATWFLDNVVQLARENGCVKNVLLHVDKNNYPAIRMYEKYGFDPHGNKVMCWGMENNQKAEKKE